MIPCPLTHFGNGIFFRKDRPRHYPDVYKSRLLKHMRKTHMETSTTYSRLLGKARIKEKTIPKSPSTEVFKNLSQGL